MDQSTDEEFFEDFGAHLTVADCERLLAWARAGGHREVRVLVKQYLVLRRTAADALAYVAERYSERPVVPPVRQGATSYPLGFLRFLIGDALAEAPPPASSRDVAD
jgi:hypothetical protein